MNPLTNIKYQPLSQSTLSDDEDEGFSDNILYDSRLVNGPKMDRRNVFELEKLGQPRVRSPPNVHFLGRGRRTAVIIAVLIVIVLGVAAAVVFPIINHLFNHGLVIELHRGRQSNDWKRVFNNTWTESSLRVIDVDQDSLDDVIFGVADKYLIPHGSDLTMQQACQSKGLSYPCAGTFMALRGYDGKELWKSSTRSFILDAFCGEVDVNKDGVGDCIITGRHSTCQAVDTRLGTTLWIIDPERVEWSNHFLPLWNVYRGPTVPDLDNDGVMDIVVLHSRDRNDELWENESSSRGRLIIVSGRTGLPIGKGYYELPPKMESYMPPIQYVTQRGKVFILFGTGSEQSSGQLMAISLAELYKKTTGQTLPQAEVSDWLNQQEQLDGVATIYSGHPKGIIVPPVLVDIHNEKGGFVDLLVVTADASIVLLNGETLQHIWSKTYSNMEITSSPTPGHYDSDGTLDFLIHLNEVEKDFSNKSKKVRKGNHGYLMYLIVILSGVDGTELWSHEGGRRQNSSDLSLRSVTKDQDVFLVKLVSRNTSQFPVKKSKYNYDDDEVKNGSPGNSSKPDEFRTMCEDIYQRVTKDHVMCDDDIDFLTQEFVLFNHMTGDKALHFMEEKPFRFHYSLKHKPGEPHCHDLTERHKDRINMCTVLVPTSHTGAVGDVDGDGWPDYIHLSQLLGLNRTDTLDISGEVSNVAVAKYSIQSTVVRGEFVNIRPGNAQQSTPSELNQYLQSFQFLLMSSQVWTQALGYKGDSHYKEPDS